MEKDSPRKAHTPSPAPSRGIAFTGGGTGGHVFPALAVRERLSGGAAEGLFWIGSSRGMERGIVEGQGIPYAGIASGKLRRYFSLKNLTDIFCIAAGFLQALILLGRRRPAVLFSKGGYVSVPPVLAARIWRIPVVAHESDVTPGLATRLNGRSSRVVFIPYEQSRRYYGEGLQPRLRVSGNPVRRRFYEADPGRGREFFGIDREKPVILFFGGSLGARQINQLLEPVLQDILEKAEVIHQMGEAEFRSSYGSPHADGPSPAGMPGYHPVPFLREEFPDVLAAADLVVCRAGAGSLWELAVQGKPSLLIPLGGGASRGDQALNAEVFTEAGAAEAADGAALTPLQLRDRVLSLLDDEPRRQAMGRAAAALGSCNAAQMIADEIERQWKGVGKKGVE